MTSVPSLRLHAALTNDKKTLVSGPPRQLHLRVLISDPLMLWSHNQKPTVRLQDHLSLNQVCGDTAIIPFGKPIV